MTRKRKPIQATRPDRGVNNRSRVSNGKELLPGVDGRSLWIRRCRDLIEEYTRELGGAPTAREMAMVRRAAVLQVEAEQIEVKFANGDSGNIDLLTAYQTLANSLRRILLTLGLEDQSKPMPRARYGRSPLSEYLGERKL